MIKEIEKYLKSKVKNYEIFYEEGAIINVEAKGNQVDIFSEGNSDGLGVRVYLDRKIGFSTTSNLKEYKKCCDNAIKTAKLNEKDEGFVKFATPTKQIKKKYYSEKVTKLTAEKIKEYIKETIKIANKNGIKISSAIYEKVVRNKCIINSEGVNVQAKRTWNLINYETADKKTGITSEGGQESFDILNYKKLKEDIERVKSLRNRETPETGEIKLLLHPEALANLLDEFIGHNINAENVIHKQSIFVDKLNQKLFDEKLTIIDDGTIEGYNFSSNFDGEGTARKKLIVIKNGILKSYLHNSYTAHKMKMENTGHASRSYASIPSISNTNVVMEKGSKSLNKIIKGIDKGVYIKTLLGTHTMNAMTGDFSLGIVEGHIIEKGKIKNAVKDTMIAGNVFELLKSIEEIENKINYAGTGYYLPNVLFPKIKIIGK